MRRTWIMVAVAGALGCRAKPPAPDAGQGSAPAAVASSAPVLPPLALEGRWRVTEPGGATAEWTIRGAELTRRRGDTQERGWIEQPAPGRLIVRLPKGRVWFLGVARDGARLWIGPGRAGQRLADGGWVLADNGLVVADAEGACVWFRQRVKGGYHPPQGVACDVGGGRWRYTLPRRTQGRGAEQREARLVGQAVVGDGLRPVVALPE